MESTPLVGAYQRYKAGTAKLIQWLFDAASICDGAVPARRLNSKSKPKVTRKVRTDELVPLAQKIISSKKPTTDIPLDILDCTKDTIKGRQQSALWYADKGDVESNSTHRYFLTTLEEIFEVLKREVMSRRPKRKKKIELATDSNDLSNIFLHLELETPTSVGTDGKTSKKPSTPARSPRLVELEMSEEERDNGRRFAIYCLLDDFHNIRMHVQGIWAQYKTGNLSLPIACEITNRAMRIMSSLREEFCAEHPSLETWMHFLPYFGKDLYVKNARGVTPWVCSSTSHYHNGPSATCHSNRLWMPAWCALQDFQQLSCWIKHEHRKGTGNWPVSTFTGHPFARELLNITAELVELAQGGLHIGEVSDRFTYWLLDIARDCSQTYGPHTVASAQIYMDIWDVLDGQTDRALLEGSSILAQVASTEDRFDEFAEGYNSVQFDAATEVDFSGMLPFQPDLFKPYGDRLTIRFFYVGGEVSQLCRRVIATEDEEKGAGWNLYLASVEPPIFMPTNVLAVLPILSGMLGFREKVDLTEHGQRLCDSNQNILAAAHLYKGALAQGSLDIEWPDMDYILSRQATRRAYVRSGEGQETVNWVAKQYCLALGMPLARVAGKYRPTLPSELLCRKKAAKMQSTSAWLNAEWSKDQNKSPYFFYYECARSYMTYHKNIDDRLATQWRQTKKLTPCQMLFIVQETLQEDEPSSNFDLFQFAEHAINIIMHCGELLHEQHTDSEEIDNGRQAPYVSTSEVLWDAASNEARGLDKSLTVLNAASKYMREIIQLHGRDCLDRAFALSSGHMPEDMKPSVRYSSTDRVSQDPERHHRLFSVGHEPVFESGHVPTCIEAEILEDALSAMKLLSFKDQAELEEVISVGSKMVSVALESAGIHRFAHIILEEDLTFKIRTISGKESALKHDVESLTNGILNMRCSCPSNVVD